MQHGRSRNFKFEPGTPGSHQPSEPFWDSPNQLSSVAAGAITSQPGLTTELVTTHARSGSATETEMSSKKRKGEAENATDEVEHANSQATESSIDDQVSNLQGQLAAMRAQRDEALAAMERMRAAACPRCNFHADWTVRVRTMAGQVHSVACPDGPKTSILRVKQGLAKFDPKFHILQQLRLVLPCDESSSSSSSSSSNSGSNSGSSSNSGSGSGSGSSNNRSGVDGAEPAVPALADDLTLASYGVSKGGLLELLLVDMVWDDASKLLMAVVNLGGNTSTTWRFTFRIHNIMLAVVWSLVNAV